MCRTNDERRREIKCSDEACRQQCRRCRRRRRHRKLCIAAVGYATTESIRCPFAVYILHKHKIQLMRT